MNNLRKSVIIAITLIAVTFLTPSALADNYNFLAVSQNCKGYLVDNHYSYCKGGKVYPLDRNNSRTIDCSGFVGWSVYEYQGGDFECQSSSWYLSTAKALYNGEEGLPEYTKGWKGIKGSENFEPGDIMCYSGHVHIYYGPDNDRPGHYLVVNAGGNNALAQVITSISGDYFRKAQYAIRLP